MLQRLGIRGKILAVVAVPIVVLMFAAGLVTLQATRDLTDAQNVEQLLDVAAAAATLAEDLHQERREVVNYLHAFVTFDARATSAASAFDLNLEDLRQLVDEEGNAEGQEVVNRIDEIVAGAAGTPSLRELRVSRVFDAGPDGWLVWPSEERAAEITADYAAMAAALDALRRTTPESSGVSVELARVTSDLTRESNATALLLVESPSFQDSAIAAMVVSKASEARLVRVAQDVADTQANARVIGTLASATQRVEAGEAIRAEVPIFRRGPAVVNAWYSDFIGDLISIPEDVAFSVTDPALTSTLQGYAAMQELIERFRFEQLFTERLIRAEAFQPGEAVLQSRFAVQTDLALATAQRLVDPLLGPGERVPDYGASFVGAGDQTSFESIRSIVGVGTETSLTQGGLVGWEQKVDLEIAEHLPIRAELQMTARSLAGAVQQAALFTTIITAVGAILLVVASLLIALLIARRIVGPLRRLTTTATAVRQELPRLVERVALPGETVDVSEVQIPVESSDEVGRLAEAFNSVNAATLAIAGEQAALRGSISEMFVNVARRDQVLLNRQLASIDEMERTEDNPNTLSKLFALDHLATRMRRNSESLLVLAGIDTGRRLRRPMPLSDVIRTASSEIELYERVQLELDADPAMVGHSALTAAHLFAELLENATVFSDPGTPVVVRTAERDGNFIVEVIDGGIGMPPEELQEANNRVASTAASEILGAQRLGLFVVGRIARRVGASVELKSQEGSGTTAVVTMPPTMFDLTAAVDQSHTRDSTVNTELGAPAALVANKTQDELFDESPNGSVPDHASPTHSPIGVGSYRPVALAGSADVPIDDLIAADAQGAPAGTAADIDSLTDGVGATGLPTRRRNNGDAVAPVESAPIMGLPARATPAQMSAMEADSPAGFTPAVAANELAPQSAEERASMFRGFRPRVAPSEDPAVAVDPDAESLGQEVRRGAVAPDEVPVLEDDPDAPTPSFEPEEPSALAVDPVDERDVSEPVVGQSTLISTGYEHDEDKLSSGPYGFDRGGDAMAIPMFEEDDVAEEPLPNVAPASVEEPYEATPLSGVESVSLVDEPSAYDHEPAPESYPAPAEAPLPPMTSGPSIDDIIAGDGAHGTDGTDGFFGRLFGRGDKGAETQPAGATAGAFPPVVPTTPIESAPVPVPNAGAFTPSEFTTEPVGAESSDLQSHDAYGQAPAEDDEQMWETAGYVAPAVAPMAIVPTESLTPYNPGRPGTPAPTYSADQLANPDGWETAGASALEAVGPEVVSTYIPVVDIQTAPPPVADEDPDITSEVFSELSSLSAERPKVEKTRAGLAKRRTDDAPPPQIKKIEAPVEARPAHRDPDQMRSRFSSFYSGTQRARKDVAELDQRTQPASAKD